MKNGQYRESSFNLHPPSHLEKFYLARLNPGVGKARMLGLRVQDTKLGIGVLLSDLGSGRPIVFSEELNF
jgi:hypothetical protein